jgi:type II secretory pathway component PulF
MSLIFTPGQLRQRSDFYHQLAQLTGAGVGITASFEQLQRHPPAGSYRQPISAVLQAIAQGYTLHESLSQISGWLPAFDLALLNAAEQSGRLDVSFRLLADYYGEKARMLRQMLADLAYPAFLFHFAIFILPFAQFFASGNWIRYLGQTLGILFPLYGLALLGIYAAQGRHGEVWRGAMETGLGPVPVLGQARRFLALSRLSAALEALLSAGVSIVEAWELAAAASGSPALRKVVLGWKPRVQAGETPAEVVGDSGFFPHLFVQQYATGELTGKLDETLRRMHQYYQEEGTQRLRAFTQWTPKLIYLGVMLMIAWRVVQFWSAHFQEIGAAAGGF